MLRAAEFDLSTLDLEKRTVELVWTTGAAVLRGGFLTEPFWEELSLDPQHVDMTRLQNGAAPLLDSHRSGAIADILGVVDKAWLTPAEGRALVRFDSGDAGADAMRRVQEKTLRNVSVGYQTLKMKEVESKDPKRGKIPTFRAIQWQPYELSLLPIGADADATTRSGATTTPCEFVQERAMPDPENPTPTSNPAPVIPTPPTPVPVSSDRAAEERAVTLETERVLGIQRIGRKLGRPEEEISAAIEKRTKLDAFRAAAIDALEDAPADKGGPIVVDKRDGRIHAGADQRDKIMQRNENWLILRAGLGQMFQDAAKKRGEKIDLDPGESRGLTLVEMARDSLERAGVKTRGMDVMQMIGLSFTHRSGSGNSTSDFPVLLENVQHKTLLNAYATTPDTWTDWCVIGSVTDFRPHNRYRQGSLGVYEDIPEGGEYKPASMPDGEKQSISAGTKGRLIVITRQVIINDDMQALVDSATRLGRAGKLTIEVAAYNRLLENGGSGPVMGDGVTLFHANHANIGAGAGLSVASVEADRVLMATQMDPAKNELLELRPAIMLCPVGIGGQARVVNQAQYDVDAKVNARNQEPNKVVGLYRKIVDTARLTGTTRYSITAPEIVPVFEVAFLNGQQEPYLEMQQGWLVDGVQYKARLDFGVAARDWRGIVKNAGQ